MDNKQQQLQEIVKTISIDEFIAKKKPVEVESSAAKAIKDKLVIDLIDIGAREVCRKGLPISYAYLAAHRNN